MAGRTDVRPATSDHVLPRFSGIGVTRSARFNEMTTIVLTFRFGYMVKLLDTGGWKGGRENSYVGLFALM